MKDLTLKELALRMCSEADFQLDEKQARDFIRKSLGETMKIIKNSQGKILVKNCDVQQFYKPIKYDAAMYDLMDLNETQTIRDSTRNY